MLSVWMSPEDCARLFHTALTAENVRHAVVYGSSANTRLWWDLSTVAGAGVRPAGRLGVIRREDLAEQGELGPANEAPAYLGGSFVTDPPVWPH
jgi:uronate dehydrogenase